MARSGKPQEAFVPFNLQGEQQADILNNEDRI
jgi:hypothetical protein